MESNVSQGKNLKRINHRKNDYKKGIDTYKSRRKREDMNNLVRKNKREQNLRKRRKDIDTFGHIHNDNTSDKNSFEGLSSNDDIVVLQSLKSLRYVISIIKDPFILNSLADGFHNKNITSILISFLYKDHEEIVFESLWILTNISAANSSQNTPMIENTDLVPILLGLIDTGSRKIKCMSLWCISNIIGENIKYRDKLVQEGLIDKIIFSLKYELNQDKKNIEYIQIPIETLYNIFLIKLDVDYATISKIISILKTIYKHINNTPLISYCNSLLYSITLYIDDSRLERICYENIITEEWLKYLDHSCLTVSLSALQVCGNLIAGPHATTEYILHLDILKYCENLLKHSEVFRREIYWSLSNIAAGTDTQIEKLIKTGILFQVFNNYTTETFENKREIIYMSANLINSGDINQIKSIVDENVVNILKSGFNYPDNTIHLAVIDSLFFLLKSDPKYYEMILSSGCIDVIEMIFNETYNKYILNCAARFLSFVDTFSDT